jgi:hypothetical protein
MAPVVVPGDRALESSHGSPEIDLLGPQDQVVMVSHDAPRENRPIIEISNLAKGLNELDRLEVIVKDELTSCDAAVHVIDRPRKE